MAATPASEQPGPLDAVRRLGASFVALLGTRAELAVVELREEGERRQEMLVLACAAGVCFALALLFASAFVVVAFWETHRLAALGGVTLVYLAAGIAAMARLRHRVRVAPKPFEATLAELARDRSLLAGTDE